MLEVSLEFSMLHSYPQVPADSDGAHFIHSTRELLAWLNECVVLGVSQLHPVFFGLTSATRFHN